MAEIRCWEEDSTFPLGEILTQSTVIWGRAGVHSGTALCVVLLVFFKRQKPGVKVKWHLLVVDAEQRQLQPCLSSLGGAFGQRFE